MSHWNYRVVRKRHQSGEVSFGIHEVYYDDKGNPKMCTMDPVDPYGSTRKELRASMTRMMEALNKPVLKFEDFRKGG